MHLVFVYGTLKQGFPNHSLMPVATFIEPCTTVDRRPLVIAGEWFTPTLVDDPGSGFQVSGELYECDESSLAALDTLEGVGAPFGFTRVALGVDTTNAAAWAYTKPVDLVPHVHDGPYSEYEVDPRYVPGHQRDRPNRGFGNPGATDR